MTASESDARQPAERAGCALLPHAERHRGVSVELPSRAIILRAGEATDRVHVIRSGWAVTFRMATDGRRQVIAFHLTGDLLGTESLVGAPAPFSVQAVTPVVLCVCPATEISRLMGACPDVRARLLRMLVKDRRERDERVVALGARSAIRSFACLALDLHDRLRGLNMLSGEAFDCPLTQEMIADALGMTKVHISRTLAVLRRQGVLDLRAGRMMLQDMTALRRLAGHGGT